MANETRRARRRYLIIPLIIGALLLGGYTVLWFVGAGIMRDEIDKFVANETRNGNVVSYEKVSIHGFPMALRAQFDDFEWSHPGDWSWSGEQLHIVAMPQDLETLVFVPRGPQIIEGWGERIEVAPNDLRVSISETAYGAEGTEMKAVDQKGSVVEVTSLKANWKADTPDDWGLIASLRGVTYKEESGRAAGLPGVNIALSHAPGQGEEITIEASEIAFDDGSDGPPTLLKVDGFVGVDAEDYPEGRFEVTYRDERKLLSLLNTFDIATPEELLQAELVLKAYRSGKTEALVPFAMNDGELRISGITRVKVGDLPKIR